MSFDMCRLTRTGGAPQSTPPRFRVNQHPLHDGATDEQGDGQTREEGRAVDGQARPVRPPGREVGEQHGGVPPRLPEVAGLGAPPSDLGRRPADGRGVRPGGRRAAETRIGEAAVAVPGRVAGPGGAGDPWGGEMRPAEGAGDSGEGAGVPGARRAPRQGRAEPHHRRGAGCPAGGRGAGCAVSRVVDRGQTAGRSGRRSGR
jgi:hypothetical protein